MLGPKSLVIARRRFLTGALAVTGAIVASNGSVAFAAPANARPVVSANLLANGSFDAGYSTSGVPDNWIANNFTSTEDGVTTDFFFDGTQSLRLIGQYTSLPQPQLSQKVGVSAPAGEQFTLSGWNLATFNARGLNNITLRLTYSDGTIGLAGIHFPTKQTTWQQRSVTLTATLPVVAASVTIIYSIYDEVAYFDAVSLTMNP